MKVSELLGAINQVAEKASYLAKTIRSEQALFELLVEEKTGDQKNKRFLQDFKTLADVLVQELVKYHLSRKFTGIGGNIYGEECNTFTNTLGETITIEIKENATEMTDLLAKVLDGNQKAASILTQVLFSPYSEENIPESELEQLDIPVDQVGIWIDPIDSTAQYISGMESSPSSEGIYSEGLPCVVVLIGAFIKDTGLPFLGVINQPFCFQDSDTKQWKSRNLWGLSYNSTNISNIPSPVEANAQLNKFPKESVILSTSESTEIQCNLKRTNTLVHAAGAGYKLTCVVDQLVSVYFLSKGSTFKWDTCAPHAILRSLGGKIISYSKAHHFIKSSINESSDVLKDEIAKFEISYHKPDTEQLAGGEQWSNHSGIIAYLDPEVAVNVLKSAL